jgi:hypothetical protein
MISATGDQLTSDETTQTGQFALLAPVSSQKTAAA